MQLLFYWIATGNRSVIVFFIVEHSQHYLCCVVYTNGPDIITPIACYPDFDLIVIGAFDDRTDHFELHSCIEKMWRMRWDNDPFTDF